MTATLKSTRCGRRSQYISILVRLPCWGRVAPIPSDRVHRSDDVFLEVKSVDYENWSALCSVQQLSTICTQNTWHDCKVPLCYMHRLLYEKEYNNKKHLKNVGSIRYCEPPLHFQSPGVASRTPAIAIAQAACDVHNDDNDNAWQRGPLWPHGMGPMRTRNTNVIWKGAETPRTYNGYNVAPHIFSTLIVRCFRTV